VANAARQFFAEKVPSDMSSESQTACDLKGVAFVNYCPLNIEVCISSSDQDVTIVIFKECHQNDVILFHQLFGRFVSFLGSFGIQATTFHQTLANAGFVEDDFDSEDDEDDEDLWSERAHLLQDDLESQKPAMREEALQHLARWSAAEPRSHVAVAKCLQASEAVMTLFVNPSSTLAEMFPAASALKNVVRNASEEVCKDLCASQLSVVLQDLRMSHLPPVVARELKVAVEAIQLWEVFSKKFPKNGCGGDGLTGDFGSNSTRCSDLGPIHEFDDDDDFADYDLQDADEVPYP
jgi:hypothetical protein